ncbi:MAG: c-type cytochrome biogenesis protein CcmI [Paracoccus sp. (in: a-proteobacteria)]|nr:c-type cytochrome biogenesis protein CcmI [Paracoccus sp. (in: a-proteobacteria)]
MFWLILAAVTAVVVLAIMAPFRRAGEVQMQPAAAYDLQVYRDQLAEVERDLARGIITADDAARLRTEIGRKVLDADRKLSASGGTASGGRHMLAASAVLAVTVAAAIGVYAWVGVPSMPDQPLAARLAAAQASYDARPTQAEAEAEAQVTAARAEAGAMPRLPEDPQYATLIEQLREAVTRNPDDPQGLRLLAFHEARLGNSVAARTAQAHLVEVTGAEASAEDHAMLSVLMLDAAGGVVTPEAERHAAMALRLDPSNPQARYVAGLLHAQNGREDRAFPIWAGLLAEGPDDAPWNRDIRPVIQDLAWLAGRPNYVPPAEGGAAMAGPDAEMMAAAADMSESERSAMIGGMVRRLEERLATEGGSPEEWARLISAHAVLGNTGQAQLILDEAQQRFATHPEMLATINRAAAQAGLSVPEGAAP